LKQLLTTMNAYVLHLAAAHDRYLSAVDPFVTLKVGGSRGGAQLCACSQLRTASHIALCSLLLVPPARARTPCACAGRWLAGCGRPRGWAPT
jgi:hypothetical protein